ncbi:MAG TPA: DUF4062 domain-containing protein [Thermoanaerobaculia bacterium]|jgi:hypothetical protein|nr:DUF4062 domain-containing protein [Thermoanaerobaculia bacterium]
MTYKAFVASTFYDLEQHRAQVIDALRSAGFAVDPMENWSADADEPRRFSVDRLKGCSLCILLVGFRRGYIPENETRSITQIEYEEAKRRGIDVLPFLLDDTIAATPSLSDKYDERSSDNGVEMWRQTLRKQRGISTFGSEPESLRIESALARWVVTKESIRARRFRQLILSGLSLILLFFIGCLAYGVYAYQSPIQRVRYLSSLLALYDPVLFNHSKNGLYDIARPISTYTSLRADTNLASDILGTTKSFDMLANNAQFVRTDQLENIRTILRRGARVRFILWTYTASNRTQYEAFMRATSQVPEFDESLAGNKATHERLKEIKAETLHDRKAYPGTIDFRWNSRPLLYTMWVRDSDTPASALAHLGVHFYQGQRFWPSFRVSAKDGAATLANMHAEFEKAWDTSLISLPDE